MVDFVFDLATDIVDVCYGGAATVHGLPSRLFGVRGH